MLQPRDDEVVASIAVDDELARGLEVRDDRVDRAPRDLFLALQYCLRQLFLVLRIFLLNMVV